MSKPPTIGNWHNGSAIRSKLALRNEASNFKRLGQTFIGLINSFPLRRAILNGLMSGT